MRARDLVIKIGGAVVILVVLALGALVAWNMFGQGPYGDPCSYAIGCRSFYCVKHELRGERQWSTPEGRCTKSCDRDEECGTAAKCVTLGEDSREDLPPLGKPTKACLHVRPLDPDDRH
ncbi:hypothetical protein BH11MYX1_BH11MYX1_19860 [soil metagenome]